MTYKHPGVYIEEIPKFPPSIAAVETAIPAFIGYTEKIQNAQNESLVNRPIHITSMLEYEKYFGKPAVETGIEVTITGPDAIANFVDGKRTPYNMYYALQLFFNNGGGNCYIVSVGSYQNEAPIDSQLLTAGLDAADQAADVTLIVFPDAPNMADPKQYYTLMTAAVDKCKALQDRFAVIDTWIDTKNSKPSDPTSYIDKNKQLLRDNLSAEIDSLKYGAAYFPNLKTSLPVYYGDISDTASSAIAEKNVQVNVGGGKKSLADLKTGGNGSNAIYNQAKLAIQQMTLEMPPSGAVVGAYASIDNSRGVWKAPANVNIRYAVEPVVSVNDKQQDNLNVDPDAGKSINVIRSFRGRGPAIIWGARTLAGNDNEWRYVPVRRFFIMVEESTKNATFQFVFEPNDASTWVRVRSMIENFLVQQWKAGALMGTTEKQAFYVRVGLNETMSEVDVWEGRMIIEIGMAVVRPAEFIILRFSHKMLNES